MDYLKKSKLFAGVVFLLVAGLAIWVYTHITFIFRPVEAIFSSIFLPLLISIFIYYIFLPLYQRVEKLLKTKTLAVTTIMLIILVVIIFALQIIVPALITETSRFVAQVPDVLNELVLKIDHSALEEHVGSLADSVDIRQISNFTVQFISSATGSLTNLVSIVSHSAIILFTIPLLLVYLFKDGSTVPEKLVAHLPQRYHALTRALCRDFHVSASAYIGGKLLVCLYVASTSYVIFAALGLPNPFLLGLICGALDIIPYFGPFIGAAPALLFALGEDPRKALILVIGITIVQFGESYLVSPLVMKKALHIHPIVAVFLLLIAGNLLGFLGMIVALPAYTIVRSMLQTVLAHRKTNQ